MLVADGALSHCLERGIVPTLIGTADPSIRILRWFGDIEGVTDQDDYFKKDRDSPRLRKALYNREHVCRLVEEYGDRLNIAIGPFTHEKVLDRLMEVGANCYMYLPMTDDAELMKQLWSEYPKLPAINSGGNVGGLIYSLAQFLGSTQICLLAYDMSYPPNTPLEQTQYFDLIQNYRKHNRKGKPTRSYKQFAKRFFVEVKNPHLPKPWFADLIYLGYSEWMHNMAASARTRGITTTNCTQGGILWRNMEWDNLTNFLKVCPTSY